MTTAWPGDSETVIRWVRATIQRVPADSEVTVTGLKDIKVSADLTGTDLPRLALDASGVKLRLKYHADAGPSRAGSDEPDEPPQPVLREAGMLKDFRFMAQPLRIERTPVTFDVRAFDVPIVWSTFAEPTDPAVPESIHAVMPADDLASVRGTFLAGIRTKDIAPLLTAVARPLLKEGGMHLGRVHLDIAAEGSEGIRISASAGLRWKLLIASARTEAKIDITPDAVITVRDLIVGSRNPLAKFALLFVRKYVRQAIGRAFDLNAELAEGGASTRIYELRVETGDQLTVSARFS